MKSIVVGEYGVKLLANVASSVITSTMEAPMMNVGEPTARAETPLLAFPLLAVTGAKLPEADTRVDQCVS